MKKAEKTAPILTAFELASIREAIARDPDSREASDAQLARMRPASEALPASHYSAPTRPLGRPKAAETKLEIKLRLDRQAVAAFRETGPGWQTRMNDVLVAAAGSLKKIDP